MTRRSLRLKPRRRALLLDQTARVFAPATTVAVIRRIAAHNALDVRLAPTDRWLMRWAASSGSGLPLPPEAADFLPRTRVPPLAPEDAVLTDHLVSEAPYRWDAFLHSWYRSEKSAEQIGMILGIGRTAVYGEHKVVLGYMLGQLLAYGADLPRFPGL